MKRCLMTDSTFYEGSMLNTSVTAGERARGQPRDTAWMYVYIRARSSRILSVLYALCTVATRICHLGS